MNIIETKNAPSAIGPYSQAIKVENTLYCSGQIGLDPKTGELVNGLENQTKQVLKNLKEVLKAGNAQIEDVTKTTIYITNIKDFKTINEIYAKTFSNHKPARATVEVSNLPKNALIEIECIAVIEN